MSDTNIMITMTVKTNGTQCDPECDHYVPAEGTNDEFFKKWHPDFVGKSCCELFLAPLENGLRCRECIGAQNHYEHLFPFSHADPIEVDTDALNSKAESMEKQP